MNAPETIKPAIQPINLAHEGLAVVPIGIARPGAEWRAK